MPNHKLYGQSIENFKRSSSAAYKIEMIVSTLTTARQLDKLRLRVDEYLQSQPLAWKPTCTIRAAALKENNIVLSVWANSHFSWQDVSPLFKAVLGLHMHLLAAMRESDIHFRMADQAVRIEGSFGSKILDSVSLIDEASGRNIIGASDHSTTGDNRGHFSRIAASNAVGTRTRPIKTVHHETSSQCSTCDTNGMIPGSQHIPDNDGVGSTPLILPQHPGGNIGSSFTQSISNFSGIAEGWF